MYNPTTSSGSVSFNESLDTKYTVAELLSSLASGGLTPTSQYPTSMPSFVSDANHSAAVTSAPALLTPGTLLTPSTLNSIEQTFIELQNVPSTTTGSHVTESGFVPPIVSTSQQQYQNPSSAPSGQNPNMVIKQEYPGHESYYSDESSQDPDWASEPSPKRMRNGDGNAVSSTSSGRRTGPRGRRQDSDLSHDELEKRQVRRERNKLAAAKCRQRRVDLTNTLQVQTEGLENEKQSLESEIQQLQSQKEQLEFLLQAHTPVCSVKGKLAATSSAALSRPTSLPLTSTVTTHAVSVTVSEALGVPITTPSSSMFGTLGLDSMMDGHTGLTPLTGAAPSCASEVQRSHSDNSGSSPSDLASPTTLMAL